MDPLDQPVRRCPHCDEVLRSWALGDITVDGCDGCGGVWFDAQELEGVARQAGEPLQALEGEFERGLGGAAGGGSGQCPTDRTVLVAKTFKQAPEVPVQCCPTCGGVWLGEGDLATLGARLPQRSGPPPLVDRLPAPADHVRAQGLTALSGLLRTRRCPHCDAENPELELRCHACGRDLHALPRGGVGEVLSRHPLRWGLLARDVVVLLVVLLFCYVPSRHGTAWSSSLPPAWRGAPAVLLPLAMAFHWLLRVRQIDATAGGLVVHRPWGTRLVPWDSIRGGAVFDLASLRRRRRRCLLGFGSYRPGWDDDDLPAAWEPLPVPGLFGARWLMVLYTTRGVLTLGPDLDDHAGLISRVREHLD